MNDARKVDGRISEIITVESIKNALLQIIAATSSALWVSSQRRFTEGSSSSTGDSIRPIGGTPGTWSRWSG